MVSYFVWFVTTDDEGKGEKGGEGLLYPPAYLPSRLDRMARKNVST